MPDCLFPKHLIYFLLTKFLLQIFSFRFTKLKKIFSVLHDQTCHCPSWRALKYASIQAWFYVTYKHDRMCLVMLWLPWLIATSLVAQNNSHLSSSGSEGRKSKISLTGLKSRCWQGSRKSTSLPPPASAGGWHGSTCGLIILIPASVPLYSLLSYLPLPFPYKKNTCACILSSPM